MQLRPHIPLRWVLSAVVGALVTAGMTVAVTLLTDKDDRLAAGLVQVIFLALGIWSSWYFGQRSLEHGAQALARAHATKAIRRIADLGRGVNGMRSTIADHQRLCARVAASNGGDVPLDYVQATLEALNPQIDAAIGTASALVYDWGDLAPGEVEALKEEASSEAAVREMK